MKIAFRVDGGSKIGMGHLMRCLALARAFLAKKKNIDIFFISREDRSVNGLIKENGFKVVNISSRLTYHNEIAEVKKIILAEKINLLITDSYEIKQAYLLEMKKAVQRLVSIHDFAPFAFPADIVINGNIYGPELDYRSLTGRTKFLLGIDYTLLRAEFNHLAQRKVNKKLENILITVGGGDPLNLTPRILETLKEILDYNIHLDLVIGPAFNNVDEIIKIVKTLKQEIRLYFNLKKMSQLMQRSDLAITAGGGTLYETAAAGTPALVLLQAENQLLAADALEKMGVIKNLGPGNNVEKKELADGLKDLFNYERRLLMSQNGQKLIDGRGTFRCVDEILKLFCHS